MLELSLDIICVNKKARGLQIKGKINIGVHPVFPVPVSLPPSDFICSWF